MSNSCLQSTTNSQSSNIILERIHFVNDHFTRTVHHSICRALFHRDRHPFSVLLALAALKSKVNILNNSLSLPKRSLFYSAQHQTRNNQQTVYWARRFGLQLARPFVDRFESVAALDASLEIGRKVKINSYISFSFINTFISCLGSKVYRCTLKRILLIGNRFVN